MEFLARTRDEPKAHVVAEFALEDGEAEWSGDWAGELREWLVGRYFYQLDGEFDETNPAHVEQLPRLVFGSRLWAVKEEG